MYAVMLPMSAKCHPLEPLWAEQALCRGLKDGRPFRVIPDGFAPLVSTDSIVPRNTFQTLIVLEHIWIGARFVTAVGDRLPAQSDHMPQCELNLMSRDPERMELAMSEHSPARSNLLSHEGVMDSVGEILSTQLIPPLALQQQENLPQEGNSSQSIRSSLPLHKIRMPLYSMRGCLRSACTTTKLYLIEKYSHNNQ